MLIVLQYGEIIDIRFPSLRYNKHRRFCYLQFKLPSEAKSATELDGQDVGDDLKLVVKQSNPEQKKPREGAMYDGREIYLSNLEFTTTRAAVKEAFKKYGSIESVRLLSKTDGKSKGTGFVVFKKKVSQILMNLFIAPSLTAFQDDAEAALEMNLTKLGKRDVYVSISTNDRSKRKGNRADRISASARASESTSTSGSSSASTSASRSGTTTPHPPRRSDTGSVVSQTSSNRSVGQSKVAEIGSRTFALLNIPDTVNDARIRALVEPYGELVKVSLRPSHQGAIVEYKDEASVGRAGLSLEGHEIAPGRKIRIGTVSELSHQKAEHHSDRTPADAAAKTINAQLLAPIKVRRPIRGGGKGGLGIKRGGVGLSGPRATNGGKATGAEKGEGEGEEKPQVKSNAEFKAMYLKKREEA